MDNTSGLGKAAGIIGIVGLLLLLSSCSAQAITTLAIIGMVICGIGIILGVIAIVGVALKDTNDDAKSKGTSTGIVPSTSTSQRKGTAGTTSTSQRLAAKNSSIPEIRSARQTITDERLLAGTIQDKETRDAATTALDAADKVVSTLATKPEKIKTSYQFLNYYLPTIGVILKKYQNLEASGVETGDTKEKVVKYMGDIQKVMDKQYENLYEDDKLDLAVEMEAMTISAKRDGLLSDTDVTGEEGNQMVTLSL